MGSLQEACSVLGEDPNTCTAHLRSIRVTPTRPRESSAKAGFLDDSANEYRLSGDWCADLKSEPECKSAENLGQAETGASASAALECGAVAKIGASWLRKMTSKLFRLFRTEVSEEDLACLAGQVARSNLKAIHAFSKGCGYQRHAACRNRVCEHRSRFVALVRRRLSTDRYLEFLLDFNQFLNHVEKAGPEFVQAVKDIQAKLHEYPEHREFQRLVSLYASERGYLPSKGLDFTGCKEEIAKVDLTPEQIKAKSHVLQAKLAQAGLRIGRFEDVVSWMTPSGRGGCSPVFTYIYCSVSISVFALMAGAYPSYLKTNGIEALPSRYMDAAASSTPGGLASWVSIHKGHNFVFDYLLLWGGRYAPALELGETWRWFTSPFIHQNFQHVLANFILLTALAGYVEYHHGTWRTILVFFLTSLAGNFLSATFEDQCLLVVGASGAVFGFMGFYVADYIVNFESVKRPLFQIVIILGFALFFAFTIFGSQGDSYVSHFSHIGGFICGIFPSFLIVPNRKAQRCKAASQLIEILKIRCRNRTSKKTGWKALRHREMWERSIWSESCYHSICLIGFLVLAAMFLALPVYLYANRLSGVECPN